MCFFRVRKPECTICGRVIKVRSLDPCEQWGYAAIYDEKSGYDIIITYHVECHTLHYRLGLKNGAEITTRDKIGGAVDVEKHLELASVEVKPANGVAGS